ncbi:MAG TPA: carboxypeptidase-like regulatory domain-containing protein, partial [Chthoniobacterales bacterium]
MMRKWISAFGLVTTQSYRNPIDRVPGCKQLEAVIRCLTLRLSIMVFLSCMASVSLKAQEAGQKGSGTVTGSATDPQHSALQGARVELQPKGLTSVSDEQGQFTIPGVPPGSYTLTVSYLGFSQFSAPVTVTAGQVAQVESVLQVGLVNQEVVVRGEREHGEIEALNIERTADNII